MRTLGLLSLGLSVSFAVAGCTAGKADVDEDFSDLAGVDSKSDYFSAKLKLLGALKDGDAAHARYTANPRFRGYSFTAAEGDEVDVWVRSGNGDALAWITDGKFKVVSKNDDASADTYDAHLVTKLPASGTAAGTYYVIFRDYDMTSHSFDLAFKLRAGGGEPWGLRAEAEIEQMVTEFTPLERYTIAKTALPAAGKARWDASAGVLEVPTAYKVPVAGKPVYVVLATDGSGEGNTVVVDLIDGAGTWFSHGAGHAVWDGGGLHWTLDLADPTMCKCEHGAGQPATCTWMDGSKSPTTEITCE